MDEKEFLFLIKRHSGIIHKVIFLYVDHPQDKKDLYQEVLLQAWKSIARFKRESTFSTWLYRVALNTVLTYRRKETRIAELKNSLDVLEYETPKPNENSDKLMNAIKKLNDTDKTVIMLHLEDYSNEEISQITGLSKGNVSVKLHRVKVLLTDKLKRQKK
ncbi:RNA polymerase sigma factor [Ekhidna sp.]